MMYKILLVTPELEYTGALQSYRRMCKVLNDNGYKVSAVSYKSGPFAVELKKIGIDLKIIDIPMLKEKEIIRYIKQFDLVLANTIETYKVADIAQLYIPTIWYIREADNLPEFFGKDPARKEAFERARNIYAVSEYAQEYIVNNFNENVRVLHNCVEDDVHCCAERMDKKNNIIKFLAMGTIEERKGYDIFFHAFMQLPEKLRNRCELHFAGRLVDWAKWFYEPLLDEIRKYPNIVYHGEMHDRNQINQLIKECDCVVVVSRDESCSLVVLEAAMQSKPVIVTENVGAKYLIDQESGWCIKTGNVEALRAVYEQILLTDLNLIKMGEKARKNYLETSTYEIYERNFLRMIRENIENPYRGQGRTTVKEFLEIECEKKLVSFDVFDTLITRNTLTPRGIFALVHSKIQSCDRVNAYTKANYYTLRISAEEEIRKKCGGNKCEDITLDEIYAHMCILGINSLDLDFLKAMEIETEQKNTVPILENIHKVENYVKNGIDTVLISDMYLSEKQIRDLLIPYSDVFKQIEIYVSSEYRKTKRTGNLFRIVRRDKKVAFHEWVHFGDNLVNDVQRPQALGIHAEHFDFPVLDKYFIDICKNCDVYHQLLFGTARNLLVCGQDSMMYKTGVTVGGTILFPYAEWIIDWAVENEIDTLYFIARDGYIIKKLVETIIMKRELSVKTKYMYGSRKAWRLPALVNDKMNIAEYIKASNWNFISTIGALATVLGVTEKEIIRYSNTAEKNRNGIIGKGILFKIIEELETGDFKELLVKKVCESRENVYRYISQEISFHEKFAFVEMSGTGYTQHCLQMLIESIKPNSEITTLFFNLKDRKQYKNCHNICFIPNNIELAYVIELFSRSLENQTIGYREVDGKVLPVFEGNDEYMLAKYGYGTYIDGVIDYMQEALRVFSGMKNVSPNINMFCDYIKGIFNGSCQEVLPFISNMPYDCTGRQGSDKLFAPRPTNQELLNIHFLHFAENEQLYYAGSEYVIGQKMLDDKQKRAVNIYKKYRENPVGRLCRGILLIREHGLQYSCRYIWQKRFKG